MDELSDRHKVIVVIVDKFIKPKVFQFEKRGGVDKRTYHHPKKSHTCSLKNCSSFVFRFDQPEQKKAQKNRKENERHNLMRQQESCKGEAADPHPTVVLEGCDKSRKFPEDFPCKKEHRYCGEEEA